MVVSRISEGKRQQKFKEMARGRSKPLHNFSMPCLKWGNQRLLRCIKVNSNGEIASVDRRFSVSEDSDGLIIGRKVYQLEKRRSPNGSENFKKSPLPSIEISGGKSEIEIDGDDKIEAIRAKLMVHLRMAADKMKSSIPDKYGEEESAAAEARPRNLSTRRAACNAPVKAGGSGGEGGGSINEEQKHNSSPPRRTENPITKSLRLRGLALAQRVEKKERAKFSITLSRGEIEEDFLAFTGMRPPRRPKKRAKIIQKQLNAIFPGLWLSEITPDSYKVHGPETGKR